MNMWAAIEKDCNPAISEDVAKENFRLGLTRNKRYPDLISAFEYILNE